MSSIKGAETPKTIVDITDSVEAAERAHQGVSEAIRDRTARIKAGEPMNSFRIIPQESVLLATLLTRVEPRTSIVARESNGDGPVWRHSDERVAVTTEAPLRAASIAVSSWENEPTFTFRDHPMHRNAEGQYPGDVLELSVGLRNPGLVEIQEVDPNGEVVASRIIGQPLAAESSAVA